MTLNNKKMIIVSLILALSVILLLIFVLLGVNLGLVKISSVSYLMSQYDLVKKAESELTKTQQTYYNTISSLESAQTEYNKQKNKYNSISDETINIIKEATTEETYNLEYMWIKLGNYARKNNLEIVMVEPGGQTSSTNTNTGTSENTSTSTNTNTNTKTSTSDNSTTTTKNSNNITNNTASSTVKNQATSDITSDSTTKSSTSSSTSSSSILKIQVTGSYMNTSDFIFEVENDNALRFKLDNISMDYVQGTTIKTSFDVKNITVNK